jgi:ACS family sodium-dependent inorganic phosphate cotransporter-like MFS transporter 5
MWFVIDHPIYNFLFFARQVTQLPGGIIAQKYGGKWPLGIGILITAIFALLTPIAARTHVGFLIGARVIQGLGEVCESNGSF